MRNPKLSKINFQSCLKKDPLKEKKKNCILEKLQIPGKCTCQD